MGPGQIAPVKTTLFLQSCALFSALLSEVWLRGDRNVRDSGSEQTGDLL